MPGHMSLSSGHASGTLEAPAEQLEAVRKGQRSHFPLLGFHWLLEPLALQAKAHLNENISYWLLEWLARAKQLINAIWLQKAFRTASNKKVLSRSPGVHKNPGLLTVLLLRRREGCGFLYRPVMLSSTKAGKSTLSNCTHRVQRFGKLLQYLQRHYRAIGLLLRSPPMYPALFERDQQHPLDCKHRDLDRTRNSLH